MTTLKNTNDDFNRIHNGLQDQKEKLAPLVEKHNDALLEMLVAVKKIALDTNQLRGVVADTPIDGMMGNGAAEKLYATRILTWKTERVELAQKLIAKAQETYVQALYELDREITEAEHAAVMVGLEEAEKAHDALMARVQQKLAIQAQAAKKAN